MIEAKIIRRADGLFQAATAYDAEILGSLKMGQGYNVKITQGSNRSLQHHRLFFGGLLPLAFQYWRPTGGMVGKTERDTVLWVVKFMCQTARIDPKIMLQHAQIALDELAYQRAAKYETTAKSMKTFRKWLTCEAGYFDVVETPTETRKQARSIAFHQMSQEEFNAFYKNCFDVVWNMFLKQHFESEEQAQMAAQELLELGQ